MKGAALALLLALAGCTSGDGVIALEGATLIDGSGGEPVRDALVLVQQGHIQAVARVNEIPVPRGAQVVNLIGKTIIPGLIDAHAHVERWAAERYLAWGVTTVRDLGATSTDSAIALKNDFDLGSVLGPRMLTSGAMIDGAPPTYATATAVRTAPEVRRAVDLRADQPDVVLLLDLVELGGGLLERRPALHRVGQEPRARGLQRPLDPLGDLERRAAQHLGIELVRAALDLALDLVEQRDDLVAVDREAVARGLLLERVRDPLLPVDEGAVDVEGDPLDTGGQRHEPPEYSRAELVR